MHQTNLSVVHNDVRHHLYTNHDIYNSLVLRSSQKHILPIDDTLDDRGNLSRLSAVFRQAHHQLQLLKILRNIRD